MIQEKITVDILGRQIQFSHDEITEIEASALAAQVQQRMSEIQDRLHIVDTMRLSFLVAMFYANDLRKLETKHRDFSDLVSKNLRQYRRLLEESLK